MSKGKASSDGDVRYDCCSTPNRPAADGIHNLPMRGPIRYAANGDVSIAYQIIGKGPIDLIYAPGIWSNLDLMWEWPSWAGYLEALGSFCRLIAFDMRGVGLSDRGNEPPIVELQVDDLRAVMDAAGCEKAAIYGAARGAAMVLLFAATFPERVSQLVLYAPVAKALKSDGWPYGRTESEWVAFWAEAMSNFGAGSSLAMEGPDHEAKFVPFYARLERQVASPGAFRELTKLLNVIDVSRVLPHIAAPTLVLQRREDQIVLVDQGRAVAERIPHARYIEMQGGHHFPWLGEWEPIVGEIGKFLTGMRPAAASERVLATVLFTDIVASTETAVAVGDRRWKELLAHHRSIARRLIADYRGVEQDAAGDGFMATFDGPARAIRCGRAIVDETVALGLRVRAGIHTGECERVDGGVAGIAVHIAARVAADAEAGEVRVSSTVRDLVAGSGIAFSDLGGRALKGVPERWHLYRVEV